MELRDTGRFGFELPEKQLKPMCEENIVALKIVKNHILEKYLPKPELVKISSNEQNKNLTLSLVYNNGSFQAFAIKNPEISKVFRLTDCVLVNRNGGNHQGNGNIST